MGKNALLFLLEVKMLKINRYQKIILRDLFRASGILDAYTFYRRYKFDVFFLVEKTKKLIRLGLVEFENTSLRLTDKGKTLLLEENIISKGEIEKPWLIIPDKFKDVQILPWEPYIPSKKLLDKKFFKI